MGGVRVVLAGPLSSLTGKPPAQLHDVLPFTNGSSPSPLSSLGFSCPPRFSLTPTAKRRAVVYCAGGDWTTLGALPWTAAVGRPSPRSRRWASLIPRLNLPLVCFGQRPPRLAFGASTSHAGRRGMAPPLRPLCLMDLPSEILELVLVAVADPWSLRSLSQTCRRLAAATAPSSPLWRALLAKQVDLTPLPQVSTEWETEFYCYWDDSYGEDTDEVAFEPPLALVRGWVEGVLPAVPSAVVDSAVAQLESSEMVAGEVEEYGEPTRDGGPPTWETGAVWSAGDGQSGQEGADQEEFAPVGADDEDAVPDDADEEEVAADEEDVAQEGADGEDSGQEDADGDDSAQEDAVDVESVPDDAGGEDAAQDGADDMEEVHEGAAGARRPVGSFLYVDNRASGTRMTAPGATAAAAGHPGEATWEDDPHTIYTGLATLSRAAAAVHSARHFHCDCGWGTEALNTQWHLLAVRVTPGSIIWPVAGATKEAVVAAADALMVAAGADTHARAPIAPRVGGVRPDPANARQPWSGRPAGELFRTYVSGPAMRHVLSLERSRNHAMRDEWSPAMRATHGAAFTAIEEVLGDRPALAFHFGENAMNPTGGVIAVQWSPSLVLGVLLPIVHT